MIRVGSRRCLSTGVRSLGGYGSHTDWNMQYIHETPQGFMRGHSAYYNGVANGQNQDSEIKFDQQRNQIAQEIKGEL